MDHGRKASRPPNPRKSANIFSIITFFYTKVLFLKGYENDLHNNDVYATLPEFKAKTLGDKLELEWSIAKANQRNPSVYKLILSTYGKTYLLLGVLQLIVKTTLIMLQPKYFGKFVAYFESGQTKISERDALYSAAIVVGLNIISCIYNHNYVQYVTEFGMKIRTSFCSLVYRKALKVNPTALSEITIGKIVTIMTKDVFSFDSSFIFINDMWIGLVQTAIITYMIYCQVGVATFAGMGLLVLVIPIQVWVGTKVSQTRLKAAKRTDERLQVTQETLSAIKIIKMYTWEMFFNQHLKDARKDEINKLKIIYYLKALTLCIGSLCAKVSFFLLIITYLWFGNHISAELIYFVLNCFHQLRSYITISIPLGISQSADLVASLKRIQNFLDADEIKRTRKFAPVAKPKIYLRNAAVQLKNQTILHDVSLDVTSGLWLVTGPVGSGKTTLLKTLLKENPLSEGMIEISGSVSYASQEPWLFPSSIKQNILFGQSFERERYEEVVKVCGLTHDLNQFEEGDETIVGDRGVNLSKGQQARINLARAVYKKSDIYLLDDSLTALDAQVNKFVFQECIKKFLSDKICILVTHNVTHLKDVKDILLLENGKTLTLENQKKQLDNRITYYIDDEEELEYESDGDVEASESSALLSSNKANVGRNIYSEEQKTGKVNFAVYKKYYAFTGGVCILGLILTLFFLGQVTISYTDLLISKWVNVEPILSNFVLNQTTNSTAYIETLNERNYIVTLYKVMVISSTVLIMVRAYTHFYFSSNASRKLHNSMAFSLLNSGMSFFDSHLLGNILNRFSKDLATIDEYIPFILLENYRLFFTLIGVCVLILSVNWMFAIPGTIIFICFYHMRKYYLPTGRSLKRLDASTRSPMVGYLNATLEGLTSIRAYQTQDLLRDEFDKHQDHFTSANYMMICSSRAFGFALDMVCSLFITVLVFYLLVTKSTQAGAVGLVLTQAFMLTGMLQWAIRQWAEMESQMTSVERVTEYINIEPEKQTGLTFKHWPHEGRITLKNVSLFYNKNEQVLKDISFEVVPKQKIGIVGRTGAGKSSLITSLFRLYDFDGKIIIDNVDTKTLKLEYLRSSIGIIPQDPILFSGSVRSNIDPTGLYKDADIWSALQKVNLKDLVPNLDHKITESGNNFSSGQRQLICLARALVSRNRIIVLDEATANMDPETDALLHRIIKENFQDCTVLTIAHRLHSVMESDKVLVIEDGAVEEYDSPQVLMENKQGLFYRMVKNAGL